MHNLTPNDSSHELQQILNQRQAVMILFGAPSCGVCQGIKPRLTTMLNDHFPKMKFIYIDCITQPDIAANHNVFALPVVELYFQGQAFGRFSKVFSMVDVKEAITRPYSMLD
ncbi:thioredoxin family protein [Shewanella psychrotolerans]|uniref:thioredoxin family protein n=1 Tax=Shewanella psychrotolerans TaxID=2864206 RepID=UPI001C65D243|nr:thioredoxin family protein [Shewanella psychrotolerans]QYK01891.1 thioredoxin family protein [Shewanella psychrotolerans]